jgi:hypothetical protein
MTRANGATPSGPLWEAVVDGTGRRFGFHYNIIGIDPDFRADNGFVPRVGYVQPSISNRWTLYGKPGSTFERFTIFHTINGIWQYDDFFAARSLLEDHASVQAFIGARRVERQGDAAVVELRLQSARLHLRALWSGRIAGERREHHVAPVSDVHGVGRCDRRQRRRLSRDVARSPARLQCVARPSTDAPTRVGATYVSSSFTRRSDDERTAFTRIPRIKVDINWLVRCSSE